MEGASDLREIFTAYSSSVPAFVLELLGAAVVIRNAAGANLSREKFLKSAMMRMWR